MYGKRLSKKVSLIESASRHAEDKPISFESKGKFFTIKVEKANTGPGLTYETLYTCRNIYINDELVCKVHGLERLFTKCFLAEFSDKRHDYEIGELIDAAYKKAKQLDKLYWKERFAKQQKESSFYDTKTN
jgi:hypothetical protein